MRKHLRRIAAISNVAGDLERLERFVARAREADVDALAVIGNFGGPGHTGPDAYRAALKILGEGDLPTFFVPGRNDAPIHEYLAECYNAEIVFPHLRGVHGTFAFGPGHVVFAGLGGEIVDGKSAVREEGKRILYPGWEAEYRLKVLHELKDYLRVFLFETHPHHKGLHEEGSTTLEELIKTHSPRVAVVAGPDVRAVELGTTLVVSAPPLATGQAALVDVREHRVEPLKLD